jgi:hypothetical protein
LSAHKIGTVRTDFGRDDFQGGQAHGLRHGTIKDTQSGRRIRTATAQAGTTRDFLAEMKMARRDFWSMATIGFRGFEY